MATVNDVDIASIGHLINGKIVTSGPTAPVVSPVTGEVVAQAPSADSALLNEAVAAAKAAQPAWAALPHSERQEIVRALGKAVLDNHEVLGKLQNIERGDEAGGGEVFMALVYAEHLAGEAPEEQIIEDNDERMIRLVRKPLGVVGAITPWNAPLLIAAEKIFSSILVGNTVVLKPSPFTPFGTLQMGLIWKDMVPPGVINIVGGGDQIGVELVDHPDVPLISFTGSVRAGKAIASAAGKQLKRVLCELGGNDAAIVLPDVDPEVVAPALYRGAFMISGQACAAVKRVYVHESIYDDMVAALADVARSNVAAPAADGGTMGPLITKPQLERISELVDDAVAHGGKAVTGGGPSSAGGYYYNPTIVTGVGEGVRLVDEEQFGPALPIIPFSDVEDAIRQANGTEYGLAGSIWTSDLERGAELASRLECGTAWVNFHTEVGPQIPFGGFKSSGVGRSGGRPGIEAHTELQTQIIHKNPAKVKASA